MASGNGYRAAGFQCPSLEVALCSKSSTWAHIAIPLAGNVLARTCRAFLRGLQSKGVQGKKERNRSLTHVTNTVFAVLCRYFYCLRFLSCVMRGKNVQA